MKKIMKTLSLIFAVGAIAFGSGLHHEDTKASAAEETWTLVKDASTLAVDDQVIIAAKGSNFAMSTTQNSNNRAQAAITKSGETATFGSGVQILTLKNGKTSGTFAFYTGKGYLYAASSSKNYLKTEKNLTDNSSWTISITSAGVATIKATGSNTRNWMKYNSSNNPPLFSCYSSGQADICLYKLEDSTSGEDIATITLSNSTLDLEVGQSETIIATTNPAGETVTWSSDKESVATVSNGKITAVGAGTATITAKSASGATATCTVNVTEPLVLDHAGTADDPYSVADALKVIGTLSSGETTSEQYYVKGIVSSTPTIYTSSASANFDIKDENDDCSLYSYKIRHLNNSDFTSSTSLNIDDKIIIIGYLQNYNGNKPEIKEGYIHSFIYELDQEKINEVILLINAIGDVVYTAESKAKIDAARLAYDALNNNEKAKVENYSVLTNAETEYEALKLDAEKEALAQTIIDQINAIGEVTDYSKASQIAAAREAYNTADDAVKALVDANGATQTLIDAEIELAKYAPKYYEIIFSNNLTEGDSSTDNGSNLDSAYENITPDGIEWGNGSKVYNGKNSSVKLGSGSAVGYFNLSITDNNYYISEVIVVASQYGSDTSKIQIEIDGKTQDSSVLTSTKTAYSFDVSELKSNSVKIGTSGKRGYIYSVTLYYAEHTSDIDQAKVDEVIEKINNIGTPNASLTFKKDLEDAEAAFEALTSAEQEKVTNYETLVTSRTRFDELVTYSSEFDGISSSYDPAIISSSGLSMNCNIAGGNKNIGFNYPSGENQQVNVNKAVADAKIASAIGIDASTTGVVTLHTYFYNGFFSLDLKASDNIEGTIYYLTSNDGGKTYTKISESTLKVSSGEQIDVDVSTENITDLVIAFALKNDRYQRMELSSLTYYNNTNAENADFLLEYLTSLDTCTEYSEAIEVREYYENLSDYEKIVFSRSNIIDNDEDGNEIVVNAMDKLEYMETWKAWKDAHPSSNNLGSNLLSNLTSSNNTIFVLIVGLLGLTSILGYYFLNKKKYAK